MKKLTSFALGPIIGLSVYYILNFIDELIASNTKINLSQIIGNEFDVLILWPIIFLLPIIFFFLLRRTDSVKKRIINAVLFFVGMLCGYAIVFITAMVFCFGYGTTKGCYPFYFIVTLIIGIDLIYLIISIVKYVKEDKTIQSK